MMSMAEQEHPDITKMNRFGELSEPEYVFVCDKCEEGIYKGDGVWNVYGEVYCDKCAEEEFRELA